MSLAPGPLKYMLGSPRLRHWHHDHDSRGAHNYANLMPVMDVLIGTFHDPGRMPTRYGVEGDDVRGYLAQLVNPLLPARWWRRRRTAGGVPRVDVAA